MGTDSKTLTPEAQLQVLNDKFDPKYQKFIRSVRAALRKRFPAANELVYDYVSFVVIAYSPTEQGIESPISIAARADGVDLYFNHGPKLPDPKKLLKGSGKQTRFIRLETAKHLAHPDVEAFIAGAVSLASVPMPSKGKGKLIIKTFKQGAAKKRPRAKSKK
jgi:hypothetical protein